MPYTKVRTSTAALHSMHNPLSQKVNFYVSIGLIASFGLFTALTVIQAIDKNAPIVKLLSSPIELDLAIESY